MKIKALKPFCGTVTMGIGEEKDVADTVAYDLIAAGYATACVDDKQYDEALLKEATETEAPAESEAVSETTPKTTKKAAAKK